MRNAVTDLCPGKSFALPVKCRVGPGTPEHDRQNLEERFKCRKRIFIVGQKLPPAGSVRDLRRHVGCLVPTVDGVKMSTICLQNPTNSLAALCANSSISFRFFR